MNQVNKKIKFLTKEIEKINDSEKSLMRSALFAMLSVCYLDINNYKESFLSLYKSLLEAPDSAVPHLFVYFLLAPKYIRPSIEIKKDKLQHIEKEFSRENNFASHTIISVIRYLRGDFNAMENHLSRALEINPKNQYLVYYYARCYSSKREYRKALNLYEKIDISVGEYDFIIFDYFYDRAKCYSALALDSWRKDRVDNTSEIITDSIEFVHNVKFKLEKNKERVDKSYIKAVDVLARRFVLFNEILILDSKFKKIFESDTFNSLFLSLSEIIEFVRNSSMFAEVLRRKKLRREILSNPVGLVVAYGYIKVFCIACLFRSLKTVFPEKFKKIRSDIDFSSFELYRDFLLNLGFIKGKQALDAVETFVSIMQHTKREELCSKEKELIRLLKPAYILNGELSRYMAEKEFQEGQFKFLRNFIQQEQKSSTDKIVKSMKAIIKPSEKRIEAGKPETKEEKLEYEEEIDLKDSTLEVDYISNEPIVKINGRIIEKFRKKELFFARFVRLAVAIKANELDRGGRIYKYDEANKKSKIKNFNLYIGGFQQKDERARSKQNKQKKRDKELYDLRKFLEEECDIYGLDKETKKRLISSKKGHKTVKLEILPENIEINIENLKRFKSNIRTSQKDKYGIRPSEIVECLIKDALEGYTNPSHKEPRDIN